MDKLLHIRVGKEIKKRVKELIDHGLFTNQTEVAREALRNLILKYENQLKELKEKKGKNENK